MDDEEYMVSDEEYEYIYSDDDNNTNENDDDTNDNDDPNSDMMSLEMEDGRNHNNNEFKRHRPGSASIKRNSTSSYASGTGGVASKSSDDGCASALSMHGEYLENMNFFLWV